VIRTEQKEQGQQGEVHHDKTWLKRMQKDACRHESSKDETDGARVDTQHHMRQIQFMKGVNRYYHGDDG
jgi:hypothetical protein